MSGNRSAWMTPRGRSSANGARERRVPPRSRRRGQAPPYPRRRAAALTERAPAMRPKARSALRHKVAAGVVHGRQRRADGTACSTVGRRIHMPSRKVTIAAGRPASSPMTAPFRRLTGSGQLMPLRSRCCISADEKRQVLALYALFVERQDVGAARRLEQEVRVLDALGNALAGHELADLIVAQERAELVVGDFGVDRHVEGAFVDDRYQRQEPLRAGPAAREIRRFSSAVTTVSTVTSSERRRRR